MIHFFPPHLEKLTAELEIAPTTGILLFNLEDAIPMDAKEYGEAGLVKVAKEMDFGSTQLWTRVSSLDSPWCSTTSSPSSARSATSWTSS